MGNRLSNIHTHTQLQSIDTLSMELVYAKCLLFFLPSGCKQRVQALCKSPVALFTGKGGLVVGVMHYSLLAGYTLLYNTSAAAVVAKSF